MVTQAWSPVEYFHELSERSKRRRTEELRVRVPVEELTFAACISQGISANTDTFKKVTLQESSGLYYKADAKPFTLVTLCFKRKKESATQMMQK